MKKITSKNPISFRVDGKTVLEIDSKGVVCDDAAAAIVVDRLGTQVTVETVTVKEAVAEAKKAVAEATEPEATEPEAKKGKNK